MTWNGYNWSDIDMMVIEKVLRKWTRIRREGMTYDDWTECALRKNVEDMKDKDNRKDDCRYMCPAAENGFCRCIHVTSRIHPKYHETSKNWKKAVDEFIEVLKTVLQNTSERLQ